jgi:hypothetical protein
MQQNVGSLDNIMFEKETNKHRLKKVSDDNDYLWFDYDND